MPTDHILALLIAERDKVNRAIEALGAGTKRRGRPPGSGVKHAEPAPTPIAKTAGTARSCKETHESYVGEAEEGREEDGLEFSGCILAFNEW
jgi:hypothetical protein